MARIAGVNIPTNKRVEIALTYIHGIGRTTAKDIVAKLGIGSDKRVQDLTDQEVLHIREAIDRDQTVEGDLRTREIDAAIVGRLLADKLKDARKELVETTMGHSQFLGMRFGIEHDPYNDPRFRHAVSFTQKDPWAERAAGAAAHEFKPMAEVTA